jgi:hypothetical protein
MGDYYRTAKYWSQGTTTKRGVPNPIVLGRKFCARCKHWRHVCDFYPNPDNKGSGLHSYCTACDRTRRREEYRRHTDEQLALRREYFRIRAEVLRRQDGVVPREFKHRHSVVDNPERILLDPVPLLVEIGKLCDGDFRWLADVSGVPERSIHRLRTGESQHVRVDLADKLAVGLGLTLEMIYNGAGVK